jgi:hypothetical protein
LLSQYSEHGRYENRGLITDRDGDTSLLQSVQEPLGYLGEKTRGHEADHPSVSGVHAENAWSYTHVFPTAGLVKHRDTSHLPLRKPRTAQGLTQLPRG